MIDVVVGPLDADMARWAAERSDPASGRLAMVVSPGAESAAQLATAALAELGKTFEDHPRWRPDSEAEQLALAWLAAHRVDRVVLVHADWASRRALESFAGLLALHGVEVTALVDPAGEHAVAGLAATTRPWLDYVEAELRDDPRRAALAADPARSQAASIGPVGVPEGAVPLAGPGPLDGPALAAYLDLAARLRLDGTRAGAVARSTVLALRRLDAEELRAALPGAAAALARGGWALLGDPALAAGPGRREADPGPAWSALRAHPRPDGPAVVGLLAAGLFLADIAALPAADVEADGAAAYVDLTAYRVPEGARAYLVAQRRLRLAEGPGALLVGPRHGRAATARSIAVTGAAVLASVGVRTSARALFAARTPSARWLAAHGLALRPASAPAEPIRMARRCRHGLPGDFEVAGVVLSHSQSLCRTDATAGRLPELVRRAANGFAVREAERGPLGVRHAVTRDGEPAGELLGLALPQGTVWLQVGAGAAPPLEAVADAVGRSYPAAAGRPAA